MATSTTISFPTLEQHENPTILQPRNCATEDEHFKEMLRNFSTLVHTPEGPSQQSLPPPFTKSRKRNNSVETIRVALGLRRVASSNNLLPLAESEVAPNAEDIPDIPDEEPAAFPLAFVPSSIFAPRRVPLKVPFGPWRKIPSSLRRNVCCSTRENVIPERFSLVPIKPPVVTREYKAKFLNKVREESRIEMTVKDLVAEVMMYDKFYDIWNVDPDETTMLIPARMLIVAKAQVNGLSDVMPIEPDIRLLDIECRSFSYPGMRGESVRYPTDVEIGYHEDSSFRTGQYSFEKGICIRPAWRRIFRDEKRPRKRAVIKGRAEFDFRRLSRKGAELGDEDSEEEDSDTEMVIEEGLQRDGWYLKFWVPIPAQFLNVVGTKTFRIQAAAWIGDEETGGMIVGEADFAVSTLKFTTIHY